MLIQFAQAATQVPFSQIVSGSTDFSDSFGNYIVAAIIILLGLMVVLELLHRNGMAQEFGDGWNK